MSPAVSLKSLAIALVVPMVVTAGVVLALALHGTPEVRLIGVPEDTMGHFEAVSQAEARISRDEAIATATQSLIGVENTAATVRQVVLGRHLPDSNAVSERGRLVWLVSFAIPDDFGPVFISGPMGRDHSCDWAFHYGYVVVEIDAESGEARSQGEGAFFDPSLPPTYVQEGNSDREYCERLQKEWQAAARSP